MKDLDGYDRGHPRMPGSAPDIEDYRFQTLDVPYDTMYDLSSVAWFWLALARHAAEIWMLFLLDGFGGAGCTPAGWLKYPGKTPLGTSVADLCRKDSTGALASPDGWSQGGDAWSPGDARDAGPWNDS